MKEKTVFVCKECGYKSPSWVGKCPSCDSWGSFKEEKVANNKAKSSAVSNLEAKKLADISIDTNERIVSKVCEFDRVVGGGLIRDSVSILSAKPGSGKSTLLLELASKYANLGKKILYISGEESESQIKSRAERMGVKNSEKIWILSTSSLDGALRVIDSIDPDLIFVDSIQTISLSEFPSRLGSPVQTVECTNKLVEVAKNPVRPRAVILVGHMTKQDEMAGLRTLEHMVDTVLILESDFTDDLRILMSTKNRFGRSGEIGLFRMQEDGIKELLNPSLEFISQNKEASAGSAVGMIKEGSRHLAVEVESLVTSSFQAYPVRISDSIGRERLNTIVAILEQRAGFKMFDKSVVLKTTGGMSLRYGDSDLAVAMSIASSYLNIPIAKGTAFIAEVGLTGEIKPVKQIEQRLNELERLGYKKVYFRSYGQELEKKFSLNLRSISNIQELIKEVFSK